MESHLRERVSCCTSRNLLPVMTRFAFDHPNFSCAAHQTTQSINVVESPRFRKLLLYFGQGRATDDEIPKRTHLTEGIIQAWKKEREDFHQEMKVR